uniref:DNA breaking-rejoining enzyme n=1 Tax=Mycena chlorophos TaxID=658473 RepID=A0ABQ0LQV4_MYCCL|nr:predicted protein [Mycena chlorophos]
MATSCTGLQLPLPGNFDFVAHLQIPAEIQPTADMDLPEINRENVQRETHNKTSMAATRAYRNAVSASRDLTGLDVGANLLPYVAYPDADIDLLVASEAVATATGPLPVFVRIQIERQRTASAKLEAEAREKREKERAEEKTEKTRASRPIIGTMQHEHPQPISSILSGKVIIPDVFLVTVFHRIHLPIHFWSEESLQNAVSQPHLVPTENITPAQASVIPTLSAPGSVRVINASKAVKLLGDEDPSKLTPGLWKQCCLNLLQAFKTLCKPVVPGDPTSPTHTHATEFENHALFFSNLPYFEKLELFPIWYPVEKALRYRIFSDGLFNMQQYEMRVEVAVAPYLNKLAVSTSTPWSTAVKRSADPIPYTSPSKAQRVRTDATAGYTQRAAAAGAAGGPERPPAACLLCTGPHPAHSHPPAQTRFADGAPLFAKLEGRSLVPATPFRGETKPICINYNIARGCAPGAHGNERLHICTLCGGDHSALARSATCGRVRGDDLDSLLDIIVTPYNADMFESLLTTHNLTHLYPNLVEFLRSGFPLGRLPLLHSTIIVPNHESADTERETTLEYIHSEIRAGRMAGPFTRAEMERICRGPFYASPLIVSISDQGPGLDSKKRVCRNLSKGHAATRTPAVNDFIQKEDFPTRFDMAPRMAELVSDSFNFFLLFSFFLRALVHLRPYAPRIPMSSLCPCTPRSSALHSSSSHSSIPRGPDAFTRYPVPRRASVLTPLSSQVASAPPGTLACAFDIKSFHRTCPVLPAHKPFLVVHFEDLFYLDHCYPFGAASASSNAGQICNALVDIWQSALTRHAAILKYEDDIPVVLYPRPSPSADLDPSRYSYAYDRDNVLLPISALNAPWHPDKTGAAFDSTFTFLGMTWDFPRRLVYLPDQKRRKYLARVESMTQGIERSERFTLLDLQQLHGALCYLCFIIPDGSSRITSISNAMAPFKGNERKRRWLSDAVRDTLRWWATALSEPFISRQLYPPLPLRDLGIYVDASTSWGIAVVIGTSWHAMRLTKGWKRDGIDICWLEAVAIEVLFLFLRQLDVRNTHILVRSDNKGAIGAHEKGRSPNLAINLCTRRTHAVTSSLLLTPRFIYVPSADNLADAPSRGVSAPHIDASRRLTRYFALPTELRDIFRLTFPSHTTPPASPAFPRSSEFGASVPPPPTRPPVDSSCSPVTYRHNLMPRAPLPSAFLPQACQPDVQPVPLVPTPTAEPLTGSDAVVRALRESAAKVLPEKQARRPKAANAIAASPFRPPVPAYRRVLLWTTPYSVSTHDAAVAAGVSPALQLKIFENLLSAQTPETRESYGAGLLRFTQFCDRECIAESLRMPAHRHLLAAFIADAIGTCTGKSIRGWLNGLQLWHSFNDAPWHGAEGWVPALKKSADRGGTQFKRPARPPITLEHLRVLHRALDVSSPHGAAVWAVALTAFWGCRRLGELLIRSDAKFSPQRNTTRDAPITHHHAGYLRVTSIQLVWTKTTQLAGGQCVLTEIPPPDADLGPVRAFAEHLRINHSPPPNTPLFAYRDSTTWTSLTKQSFLDLTSHLFSAAHLERVYGHSYRIGGSVELLKAGVAPEIVMKLGGWSSLCFLVYWRRLEQILPAAITRAWQSRIVEFARGHGHPLDVDLDAAFSS